MATPTFWVYDRWGDQKGVVTDITEAIHTDEVNGEDSLTVTSPVLQVEKGDRIVWQDAWTDWHEHVVSSVKTTHAQGMVQHVAFCENSIVEIMTDHIDDLRPYNVTATVALTRALSVTRWGVGSVTVTSSGSANFYHTTAYDAVRTVIQTWGGEFATSITVGAAGVTSRELDLLVHRGADTGKMFTYSRDIKVLSRKVDEDDVYTAMYGYGKGLENIDEDGVWNGGYERKLTFGDINGGLDYVEDNTAKLHWGLPDGNGGVKHSFGSVEFPDCEDEAELMQLTTDYLQTVNHPRVEYAVEAVDIADAGFTADEVRTGDIVTIRDKVIDERLSGRILRVERYLCHNKATVVKVGNVSRSVTGLIGSQAAELQWMRDHSASWDAAAVNTTTYLDRLMANINNEMNAAGGYTYWVQGEGIITYDRPIDQNPTKAIQINGAGFRIANSKNPDDSWAWRTFGTGDGFTADEINAGTLSTILIESLGGNNYWNLATGQAHFDALDLEIGSDPAASTADITASINALKTLIADPAGWTQIEQTAGGLYAIVETVDTAAAAAQTTADNAEAKAGAKQATSSTAAGTAAKTATCAGFQLVAGVSVTVLFADANTTASPTLNVQGTGAVQIWINGKQASTDNPVLWTAGTAVTFLYNGSVWTVMEPPGANTTTCSTAASTAAKTTPATVSPSGHLVVNGTVVDVDFTSDNLAITPTLDVAGTGAGTMLANGLAGSASNAIAWLAGTRVRFTRSGQYWLVTDLMESSYMRLSSSGLLVGQPGDTIAALVNASGSFDVVQVTWIGSTPTPGNALAMLSQYGVAFYDANAHEMLALVPDYATFGAATDSHTEVYRSDVIKPVPGGMVFEDLSAATVALVDGNGSTMAWLYAEAGANAGTDERSLVLFDASGSPVVSMTLETPGTGNAGTDELTIDVQADITVNQAAAWRTALGAAAAADLADYLPLAGGTVTGNIRRKDSVMDKTASSIASARYSSYIFDDKNGQMIAVVQTVQATNGRTYLQLLTRHSVSGSDVDNYLRLYVAADGTCTVGVSHPSAWLDALGIAETEDQTATLFTAGTNFVTSSLRMSKAGGMGQLTLNVKTNNALTAGTAYTLGTMASGNRPPSMCYGSVYQGGVGRMASTGVVTYVPSVNVSATTVVQMSFTFVVAN